MTYEERILLHEAAKRATNLSEMATIQARVSTQIDTAMKRPPLQRFAATLVVLDTSEQNTVVAALETLLVACRQAK